MGVYQRNKKLWLNFVYKGVRCYESLGIEDTKSNRKYAQRLLAEIQNKIEFDTFKYDEYFPNSKKLKLFNLVPTKTNYVKNVVTEFIKTKENKYEANIISHSSLRNNKGELLHFNSYFGDYLIDKINQIDIENWIVELAKGRKSKTINNILSTVKQLFKYAKAKGYIEYDPSENVNFLREEKPDIEPFSLHEMNAILEFFKENKPKIYPLIAFLFYTGCRTGECLAAKWENLDSNTWTYHIKESFSDHRLTKTKTKNSNRIIDIIAPLQEVLRSHKLKTFMKSDFMFLNQYGKPFKSSGKILCQHWKPALKRLGIKYRSIYQTRHTYAVLSLIAGENPHYVSKQLGHVNMQMLFTKYARYIENYKHTESKFANYVTNVLHQENTDSQIINK